MNCKLNERDVFTQEDIKKLFKSYEIVQLYTDVVPKHFYAATVNPDISRLRADAYVNRDFQKRVFKDSTLPLYAVLEPQSDGKLRVVGTFGGLILQPSDFAEFLENPVGKFATGDQQASR